MFFVGRFDWQKEVISDQFRKTDCLAGAEYYIILEMSYFRCIAVDKFEGLREALNCWRGDLSFRVPRAPLLVMYHLKPSYLASF